MFEGRTDIVDARRICNSCKQLPIHMVRRGATGGADNTARLVELLNPDAPRSTLQLQIHAPVVANLANLAAKVLQSKLLCDVRASAMASCHDRAQVANGDAEGQCQLCFEQASTVLVKGCLHSMCVSCADQLCRRIVDKPATCPFCRRSLSAFI